MAQQQPIAGVHMRLWAMLAAHEDDAVLDFVEAFAGSGAVTRGLQTHHFKGRSLDMRRHPGMDFLTPAGFCLLLGSVMALQPGGLLWAAPPCSSWVFMSRGSYGRARQIEGDGSPRPTANNALVERLVLALEFCATRGCVWIIEQPGTSIMFEYPAMQRRLERQRAVKVRLDMGAYGAESQKATICQEAHERQTTNPMPCGP